MWHAPCLMDPKMTKSQWNNLFPSLYLELMTLKECIMRVRFRKRKFTCSSASLLAPCVVYWPCSSTAKPWTFYRSSCSGGSCGFPRAWPEPADLWSWISSSRGRATRCSTCTAAPGRSAAAARNPTVDDHLKDTF